MREFPEPKYQPITAMADEIELLSGDELELFIFERFLPTCGCVGLVEGDYTEELEAMHMLDNQLRCPNVESLGLRAAIGLLTVDVRADLSILGLGTLIRQDVEGGLIPRVLRRIAELEGTWVRPSLVSFWHEDERDGYLSNWHYAYFKFGYLEFTSSEQWIMWQKARVFEDMDAEDDIYDTESAQEAKQLGRKVTPFDEGVWEDVRLPLMRVGLRHKFAQNEWMLNSLLSTGSAVLVEASPNDVVWGVGVGADDAFDPARWRGRNLLGTALMQVRSDLRMLCNTDGDVTWGQDALRTSAAWDMTLQQLSLVPCAREAVLMYATVVAQQTPSFRDAQDVLGHVPMSVGEIDAVLETDVETPLTDIGWYELVDELAFQVRVGRL